MIFLVAFRIQAYELAKTQEITKQHEFETQKAQYLAAVEQAKLDSVKIAAEERKKILQEEAKLNQQRALYEDDLARKR